MPKVDRYYVDAEGNPKCNIVIRDLISPIRNATYPADIIVEIWNEVAGNRGRAVRIAEKICKLLNEEKK